MNTKRAKAMIEIGASSKGLQSGLSEAKKKVSRFKTDVGRFVREAQSPTKSKGGKGGGFGAGFVGGLASGGLGMVSGALGEVAGDVVDLEDKLARFQIAASRTPDQMAKLRAELDRISRSTAQNRSEILDGAASYVAITGDADGAAAAMESFARVGQASGSSMADVAAAAAALRDNLNLDPKSFEAAFSALIAQGKAGAVEIKDLAGELAALAPQFASFKMDTADGGLASVAELGAAFQVARKGFGSASMAATGLKSMMTALVQNATKFEKAGIKIFDKNPRTGQKTMRNFSNIWSQLNRSDLVKDPTKLLKAFGRVEALDTFRMFNKFPGLYHELLAASEDVGTVQRDLNTYMQSNAGKLKTSFNDVKIALAEAFTPDRIQKFAAIMMKVAEAAGWIISKLEKTAGFIDMASGLATGNLVEHDEDTNAVQWGLAKRSRSSRVADQVRGISAQHLPGALAKARGGGRSEYDRQIAMYSKLASSAANLPGGTEEQSIVRSAQIEALNSVAAFLAKERDGRNLALEKAFAAALAKANVTVLLDGGAVAKKIDQSPQARNPKTGR